MDVENVTSFNIRDNLRNWREPIYERPEVKGYFSLDRDRNYHGDFRRLKYLRIPQELSSDGDKLRVRYDLDKEWEKAVMKEEPDEKLDQLLRWMLKDIEERRSAMPDVVCFRGRLTMLMCTPYENNEGWILCVSKFRGTIYICEYETEERKRRRENTSERDRRFTAWGHKFEQFMGSDEPGGVPDPRPPVNSFEEFYVVFSSTLNGRQLLFGAEIDGVRNRNRIRDLKDLAEAEMVELKTCQANPKWQNFRRYKLLKWFCQSYLVGIEQIVCGFRSKEGVVQSLELFKVPLIPKKAKNMWDPVCCLQYCDKFLDKVSHLLEQEDDPHTVWKFEWTPGNNDITAKRIPGRSEYSFLPEWYIDKFPTAK